MQEKLIVLLSFFYQFFIFAFALSCTPAFAWQTPASTQIVIIIDDLGHNLARGRQAIELPGAITYAILPHTPAAEKLAFYAKHIEGNKEVLIHMPMQAISDKDPGPGALNNGHTQLEFTQRLESAIAAVPFATGLNNHMGSQLTQHNDAMFWLMDTLQKNQLNFVDSKTSAQSIAADIAKAARVPYLSRDIFLDHIAQKAAIEQAFNQAIELSQRNGLAVIIAHPYPVTLAFLKENLMRLKASNIELVNVTQAINYQQRFIEKTAQQSDASQAQQGLKLSMNESLK